MMSSSEPIECLICHKVFDPTKFGRHLLNKAGHWTKARYEKEFNVILPKQIGLKGRIISQEQQEKISASAKGRKSWNEGLTKDTDERLAKTGGKISKALKDGFSTGKIKNWTEGKTKETDLRIKKTSDKLKGHKIFIDPHILGDINKERLEGKTWEEIHGAEKAAELREQASGENNVNWVPREIRICACGCKGTFEATKNDPQRFIFTHNARGQNNPNWRGGIDKQFYQGFTLKLKAAIRERDDNKCIICSKSDVKLDVHHIDYDKKHSVPENLVTLCAHCHASTNFNRESWIAFFKPIMEKIYGSRN
jgi:hypothetical protein